MKATIIGAGNLGGSIAFGLAKGSTLDAKDITCIDTDREAIEKLKRTEMPFVFAADARKAVSGADIVILALKPWAMEGVISEIRDVIDFRRQIIISVAAGVSFDQLNAWFLRGEKSVGPILFRVMPNIAVSIGESMTLVSEQNATKAQIRLVETILNDIGRTMFVPERLLGAGMALGSCGIAYTMRFVHAMVQGGVAEGIPVDDAYKIALQTVKAAADMLSESGNHPEVEIDRVATAGGYTIRGLIEMEKNGFSNAVISGIRVSSSPKE